jgi:hypothetical protein
MALFRLYLMIVLAVLAGYTLAVGLEHGWNLLPIFFSSIARINWPGQFNMDFLAFLSLSGLWVAWRHRFTAGAIGLGIIAVFGGMVFLAPYLLWASAQARGDVRVLLLGSRR